MWKWLVTDIVIRTTIGTLFTWGLIMWGSGVVLGLVCYHLKLQMKTKKMKNLKMLLVLLTFAILGCAAPVKLQTKVFIEPGKIDSIAVGQFTSQNPADGEIVAAVLRVELVNRGFEVVGDSPYTLSGAIDVSGGGEIGEATISLKDNSGETISIWLYSPFGHYPKGRKDFAAYMAEQITKTLRGE